MITVHEMREKYPRPRAYGGQYSPKTRLYCVAGACVKAAGLLVGYGVAQGFPGRHDAAMALCTLNPRLPWLEAMALASSMIWNNDMGKVEEAWERVEFALRWGRRGTTQEVA